MGIKINIKRAKETNSKVSIYVVIYLNPQLV